MLRVAIVVVASGLIALLVSSTVNWYYGKSDEE